jgi:hypothetical protein
LRRVYNFWIEQNDINGGSSANPKANWAELADRSVSTARECSQKIIAEAKK